MGKIFGANYNISVCKIIFANKIITFSIQDHILCKTVICACKIISHVNRIINSVSCTNITSACKISLVNKIMSCE